MGSCCSPGGGDLRGGDQRMSLPIAPGAPKPSPISTTQQPHGDFVSIPAGSFTMGDHWDEGYIHDGETPVHGVKLEGFLMGATTVTNRQFEEFIRETGYRTIAEQQEISAVFYAAFRGRASDIIRQVPGVPWWLAVRGADWKHPDGPGSGLAGREDHPVVHVSWDDAQAYCAWAGTRLPTEAEWEYAARGGQQGRRYAWGDELTPGDEWNCNIWQGSFPQENSADDGFLTTAPGRTYTQNGYGLWQMAGNVWEWCQDWFDADYYAHSEIENPTGAETGEYRVMRGGSYLCHDSYCNRYRVSARNSNTPDSTSGNIGFRCVADIQPGQ